METPGGCSVPSFYGKKDDLNEQFSYRAVEGARGQTTRANLLRRQKRFPTQKSQSGQEDVGLCNYSYSD